MRRALWWIHLWLWDWGECTHSFGIPPKQTEDTLVPTTNGLSLSPQSSKLKCVSYKGACRALYSLRGAGAGLVLSGQLVLSGLEARDIGTIAVSPFHTPPLEIHPVLGWSSTPFLIKLYFKVAHCRSL